MKSSTPPHWNDTNFHIKYPGSPYKNSHTIDISTEHYLDAQTLKRTNFSLQYHPESNIKVARIIEMITN